PFGIQLGLFNDATFKFNPCRGHDGIDEEEAIGFLPNSSQNPSIRSGRLTGRRFANLWRRSVLPASRQIKSDVQGILPDLPGQPILVTFELELAGDRVVPVCGKGLFLEIDALIGRTEDIGLLEGKRGLRLTFGSPLDQADLTTSQRSVAFDRRSGI